MLRCAWCVWHSTKHGAHACACARACSSGHAHRTLPHPTPRARHLTAGLPRPRHPAAEEQLVLQPIKTISGTVRLPGSKSLSNRILLLAALAEGTTVVKNLLVRACVRHAAAVVG